MVAFLSLFAIATLLNEGTPLEPTGTYYNRSGRRYVTVHFSLKMDKTKKPMDFMILTGGDTFPQAAANGRWLSEHIFKYDVNIMLPSGGDITFGTIGVWGDSVFETKGEQTYVDISGVVLVEE